MPERGSKGSYERVIGSGCEFVRNKRGQSPVLALGIELVGRSAYLYSVRKQILPNPGIRTLRIEPDGQVLHEPCFF